MAIAIALPTNDDPRSDRNRRKLLPIFHENRLSHSCDVGLHSN